MTYLSVLSLVITILTFAAIIRGIILQSKIKTLRNFNHRGFNDHRIELAKLKVRKNAEIIGGLCIVAVVLCLWNATQKLMIMFGAFEAIAVLSIIFYRADKKLLVEALAKKQAEAEKKVAAKQTDTAAASVARSHKNQPSILPKQNADFLDFAQDLLANRTDSRIPPPDNTREKEDLRQEDDILSSEYIN